LKTPRFFALLSYSFLSGDPAIHFDAAGLVCALSGIWEVIKGRRSVHKYLSIDVPRGAIDRILEAAIWAPSAHNAQPWRFIVITDPSIKGKLARTMAEAWDKDLAEDGLQGDEREKLTKGSIAQFTKSAVLIIPCVTMADMDVYTDERRRRAEYIMAVQSVAASIQNLLLAAHAEGFGACWFCAPLFCPEKVREVLKTPTDVDPQALITLGYPAEDPEAPPRKPVKNIVYLNHWGE